jgi:transcriptional regulator with XRE-family HTH domain
MRGCSGSGPHSTPDKIWRVSAAELLRDVRRRHGLSQAQLAARARTSQAAISRIERGLVSPSVATLASLLDLMGEELHLAAEPIDYGHDLSLNRLNMALTPEERIARQAAWSNGVYRLRRAVRT